MTVIIFEQQPIHTINRHFHKDESNKSCCCRALCSPLHDNKLLNVCKFIVLSLTHIRAILKRKHQQQQRPPSKVSNTDEIYPYGEGGGIKRAPLFRYALLLL
jgi:hypothetical protein